MSERAEGEMSEGERVRERLLSRLIEVGWPYVGEHNAESQRIVRDKAGEMVDAFLAELREPDAIEVMARAAYEAAREWGCNEQDWETISPFQSDVCQEHWRIEQRAALDAIAREGTQEPSAGPPGDDTGGRG